MNRILFLKKHFLAGIFTFIPLAVIGWILWSMAGVLWRVHQLLPDAWQLEAHLNDPTLVAFLNVLLTLVLAGLLAMAIALLGWGSKQFLGEKVLEVIAHLIQRIPVIRSIYSALDQLLKTLAVGGGQQFNRVVYLEYPRKGIWALAFVTGPAVGRAVPAHHLNVYVPTTPNPTSGFHLIVPEEEVRETHLTVEEAFRTILSLGIAQGNAQKAGP